MAGATVERSGDIIRWGDDPYTPRTDGLPTVGEHEVTHYVFRDSGETFVAVTYTKRGHDPGWHEMVLDADGAEALAKALAVSDLCPD